MFIRFAHILLLPDIWSGFSKLAETNFFLRQSPKTGELAAFFANISFLLLFGAMFFYWVNLIFAKKTKVVQKSFVGACMVAGDHAAAAGRSDVLATSATMQDHADSTLQRGTCMVGTDHAGTYSPALADATSTSAAGAAALALPTMQAGTKKPNIANKFILFANISLFLLLCIRWQESGHFPLSNLYESLIFLSWSCTTAQLFLLWYYSPILPPVSLAGPCMIRDDHAGPGSDNAVGALAKAKVGDMVISELLGSVLAPCALFLNAFATFSLPKEMQQAGPLVPALQSNWLMMHVTVMIISYAALMVGSLLSIAYLILARVRAGSDNYAAGRFRPTSDRATGKQTNVSVTASVSSACSPGIFGSAWLPPAWSRTEGATMKPLSDVLTTSAESLKHLDTMQKQQGLHGQDKTYSNKKNMQSISKIKTSNAISNNLDYLSYRIIGIGFPFLTIGILSGAVWANEAWGSYWSWDPKETWALLTWFVFAIYLHTRLTKGWEGERPAMLASFGFIVVWICYLGVNLLGEGLHSYGFLKG